MIKIWVAILLLFAVPADAVIVTVGYKVGETEQTNQELGAVSLGASTTNSDKARGLLVTVPTGGITVSHASWYGHPNDGLSDGTFLFAIFNSSFTQVGDCSDEGDMIDGASMGWNHTIWTTPVFLAAGNYWLILYPSERIEFTYDNVGFDGTTWYNTTAVTYPGDCGTFPDSAADWKQTFKLANYEWYGDSTAPTITSATLGTGGETLTVVFDENIVIGAGGSGTMTATWSTAGATTYTYSSGLGSNTLIFSGNTTVEQNETTSNGLDYTQPGNGYEDSAGNDLLMVNDHAITNNSIVGAVSGPTLYVTQDGAGTTDGTSLANAMSVAQFNDEIGDWTNSTAYFSGTFTTPIVPQIYGTADGPAVLDGYADGNADHSSGTLDTNAALISTGSANNGITLSNNAYLIIQDFRMNDVGSGIKNTNLVGAQLSHVTIRRVGIDTCSNGIYLTSDNYNWKSSYLTIQDCTIIDTAADDFSSSKASIRLYSHNDTVIKDNLIYNRPEVTMGVNGQDGIVSLTGNRVLVEGNTVYHVSEDGVDCKNDQNTGHGDYLIRFNKFFDCRQSGITIQHGIITDPGDPMPDRVGENFYAYGNLIYGLNGSDDNYEGVLIQRGVRYIAVWATIIHSTDNAGIAMRMQNTSTLEHVDDGFFANNTIVNNRLSADGYQTGGLTIWNRQSGEYHVYNTILQDNAINDADRGQIVTRGDVPNAYITLDYNLYFLTSGDPKVYWEAESSASNYTLTNPVSGTTFYSIEGQEQHGIVDNPDFTNYSTKVLTLTAASPAIDAGVVLSAPAWWDIPTIQAVDYSSEATLDKGLSPATDWTTVPPTVTMVSQGDSPEIGAYVYVAP